jgi:hypothetical protein
MIMPMPLAEIMKRKIERMSQDERAKLPREAEGNVVLDEHICEDGTRILRLWNEDEGSWIGLAHDDVEYLAAMLRHLLPDVPMIVRQAH